MTRATTRGTQRELAGPWPSAKPRPHPARDHRTSPRRPQRLSAGAPALRVFTANAAWLVLAVIAFNLTRTAGVLTGTELTRATTATTATVRRKLANA